MSAPGPKKCKILQKNAISEVPNWAQLCAPMFLTSVKQMEKMLFYASGPKKAILIPPPPNKSLWTVKFSVLYHIFKNMENGNMFKKREQKQPSGDFFRKKLRLFISRIV